jgi:hypothetical protein
MNRLEFAKTMLQQPMAVCPFLSAVDTQTRATLLEQHPDAHALAETQLLEIAKQQGFNPNEPKQIFLPQHKNENPPCNPVGVGLVPALPHNENMIHLETDLLGLELLDSRLTGRPQGSPLQKPDDNFGYLETDFFCFDVSSLPPQKHVVEGNP